MCGYLCFITVLVFGDKFVGWKGGNQSRCGKGLIVFVGSLYIMLKSCCRGEYEFDDNKVPRIYHILSNGL